MFGKVLCTVKGQIKPGAVIYQDMAWFRWPDSRGHKTPKEDQNTVFEISFNGTDLDCVAFGFGKHGVKGGYGSGSIMTRELDDLLLDAPNYRKLAAAKKSYLIEQRAKARTDVDKAEIEMNKLDAAIAALP